MKIKELHPVFQKSGKHYLIDTYYPESKLRALEQKCILNLDNLEFKFEGLSGK